MEEKRSTIKSMVSVFLIIIMSLAMLIPVNSEDVFAAAGPQVSIDGTYLKDGENTVGGGTALWDSEKAELTLTDVKAEEQIYISGSEPVTLTVKGETFVGTADERTSNSVAIWSDVSELNIIVEEGAALKLYGERCNNIYAPKGNLKISGKGTLTADTLGGWPAVVAEGDIEMSGGLNLNVTADTNAIQSGKGDIKMDGINAKIDAFMCGLFVNTWDEINEEEIFARIELLNSKIEIETEDNDLSGNAINGGLGGVLIENTDLNLKVNRELDEDGYGSYALYADSEVLIKGDDTKITIDGAVGISTDTLTIEAGTIKADTVDSALHAWGDLNISGGKIDVHSEAESAIATVSGNIAITGESTEVKAVSDSVDVAAVRVIRAGNNSGILLDAKVTASNTAGNKPFEAKSKKEGPSLIIGDDFVLIGVEVYTNEEGESYFIREGGSGDEPITGEIKICDHQWQEPVWNWNEDNSKVTAVFTCKEDGSHVQSLEGTLKKTVTEAKCDRDGKIVYRASVEFEGKTYAAEKSEVIPVLEHDYKDGKCTVCGAADPGYKAPDADTDVEDKEENKEDGAPKTGDNAHLLLWLTIMAAAAAGATVLKKREN